MENAEICVLAAVCPTGKLLRNPWRHRGFSIMAKAFLQSQTVIMGKQAWLEYPFKANETITPWVVTTDSLFQQTTRTSFPHVRFAENLDVIHRVVPLKGIWWVLGGFQIYRELLPIAHSMETIVVNDVVGTVELESSQLNFANVHSCPNPFDYHLRCARYERPEVSPLYLQHV
jgi:dihydrofolate reductase